MQAISLHDHYEDARQRLLNFVPEGPTRSEVERLLELEARYQGNLGMVIWCREFVQETREKTTAQVAIVTALAGKKHTTRRRSLIPKRPKRLPAAL